MEDAFKFFLVKSLTVPTISLYYFKKKSFRLFTFSQIICEKFMLDSTNDRAPFAIIIYLKINNNLLMKEA